MKTISEALRCSSTPGSACDDECMYRVEEDISDVAEMLGYAPDSPWINCDCDRMAQDAADLIEKLQADLKVCRNELCNRCGRYKEAHLGSCHGCRWEHGTE